MTNNRVRGYKKERIKFFKSQKHKKSRKLIDNSENAL